MSIFSDFPMSSWISHQPSFGCSALHATKKGISSGRSKTSLNDGPSTSLPDALEKDRKEETIRCSMSEGPQTTTVKFTSIEKVLINFTCTSSILIHWAEKFVTNHITQQ
jgi:hypothetical protein